MKASLNSLFTGLFRKVNYFPVLCLIIIPINIYGQKVTIEKLKELYINTTLIERGSPNAVIVLPKNGRYTDDAKLIQQTIKEKSGVVITINTEEPDPEILLQHTNVIVLGNMTTNHFIYKLYCQWYTFLDTKYPGKGGYVVRSLHNPYGTKKNIILIGGSDDEGVRKATEVFCSLLPDTNPFSVGWLMEIKLGDGLILPEIGIDGSGLENVKTWKACVNGGTDWGWNPISKVGALYYMTGEKKYLDCFKNLVKPDPNNIPVAISSFYSFVNLERPLVEQVEEYTDFLVDYIWDLIEESPLFSDEERLYVTRELLDHQYFRDPDNNVFKLSPDRHTGYALFGIYTGSRYFAKYYPDQIWEKRLENVRKSFRDFIGKPSWGNDNLFFMPSFAQYIIDFFVMDGADEFVNSGTAKSYADGLLTIRTGEKKGDYYNGVNPYLLNMIAHILKKNEYFWLVNELDYDFNSLRLGRSFWYPDDIIINPPKDIVNAILLFPLKYPSIPSDEGFEILSYRSGLSHLDDFFLIDGHNGGGRSSYHVNCIRKLRMFGGKELLSGINNDIDITCNGMADSIVARAAALKEEISFKDITYLKTEVPDMTNSIWQRNILYLKETGFIVLDKIQALKKSEFDILCSWTFPDNQKEISDNSQFIYTKSGTVISFTDQCKIIKERGNVVQESLLLPLNENDYHILGNLIYYDQNPDTPSKVLKKTDKNNFLVEGNERGLICTGDFNSDRFSFSSKFGFIDEEKIFLVNSKKIFFTAGVNVSSDVPVSVFWDLKNNRLEISSSFNGQLTYETDSSKKSITISRGKKLYKNMVPPAQLKDDIIAVLDKLTADAAESKKTSVTEKYIPEKVNWKPVWEIVSPGTARFLDISDKNEIWACWDMNSNYKIGKISAKGKVLTEINGNGKILTICLSRGPVQSKAFSLLTGFLDDTIRAYSATGKELWKVKAEVDPVYKVGDKYVAPWFSDPESVAGVFDILADDLWGNGKEQIVIGRPVTLEFRELDGTLIKRIPNQWGTNTNLKLLKLSPEHNSARLLMAGKFITGFPGITAVDSNYNNITDDLYNKIMPGWTSMSGWGQQGLSDMVVEDINNDGVAEVITTITGHWNELRVWNSNIRGIDYKRIKSSQSALPVMSGGTASQRPRVTYDSPLWMKYFGSNIEGTWIIQGILQRDPVEKMNDRFMKSLLVTDINSDGNKEIITGLKNGWVHVFNATGDLLWQHKFDAGVRCMEGIDWKKSGFLVGLSNGEIHVMDSEGKIVYTAFMDSSVEKIVTKNNRVITGTSGGTIAELRLK